LQIEDPKDRAAFLKTSPTGVTTATAASPVSFDPGVLDRVAQTLAAYIGPIAKVVVTRAARSARSAEELQNILAEEISSANDRQRFLAAIRPMVS